MLYPARCPICDGVMTVGQHGCICGECVDKLEYVTAPSCLKCGKPIARGEYCIDCADRNVHYNCGKSAFVYNKYMRESIARYKYSGRREYAAFYAETIIHMYGQWIEEIRPDALIPVPIHEKRYRKRGYNQAKILADEIGSRCGVPVIDDYLLRIKNTVPLKELSSQERRHNLSSAFLVSERVKLLYKDINCVIIIDDIYTTGSTMEACARVLRGADVNNIYFICACIGKGF